MTKTEARESILKKIAQTKISIVGAKKYTAKEIDHAEKQISAAEFKPSGLDPFDVVRRSGLQNELAMYEKTLASDLMIIQTRFLLLPKGSKLISPSGFHASEGVFLKVDGYQMLNRLPKYSNMDAYDLGKLKA